MYSIVVVIYLVVATEVKPKWLAIIEQLSEVLTIPFLVFPPSIRSVQIFECHPGGHYLHEILWFIEETNIECLTLRTLFSYGLQHIHMSNILVG